MSEILTVSEAAERLGVSPLSARRMIAAGILPARRYVERGHMRVEAEAVDDLIESSKIGGGDSALAPDGARGRDPVGQSSATVLRQHHHQEAVSP